MRCVRFIGCIGVYKVYRGDRGWAGISLAVSTLPNLCKRLRTLRVFA